MMHEMALAQEMLDIVLNTADRHGAARVKFIRILIGELTQVVPDLLENGFKALAQGTKADNADLEFAVVSLTGRCNCCSRQFKIERFRFVCPDCSGNGIDILSGRELLVEMLEVE